MLALRSSGSCVRWLMAASLVVCPVLVAQTDWFAMPDLPSRVGATMCEDPSGTGVLRFGGVSVTTRHNDLYRWDGSTWQVLETSGGPSGRDGVAMARDPVRGRVILFGGFGFAANGLLLYQDDTWEFDGTNWTRLSPATKPPPRRDAKMAWHAPTQRLVMVGGEFLNSYRSDTWEWDGTNWQLRTVATALPGMQYFRLVADPVRGKLVLHGGDTRPSTRDFGTFEWDGTDWTRMQPANPLQTLGGGMDFDRNRNRVIAHSLVWPAPSSTTHEWDGVDWTPSGIVPPPSGGSTEVVADPTTGGLLMLDGQSRPEPRSETLRLDPSGWRLVWSRARPPACSNLGLVYNAEQERVFAFLAKDEGVLGTSTWILSRNGWQRSFPSVEPPERFGLGMVFDSVRSRAVLFGGANGIFNSFDDTWVFDGQQWTLLLPNSRPPASFSHAMAYDSARDRVVLFGGQSFVAPGVSFTQTWEFDGTVWIQRQPTTLPPGRFGAVMAYDPMRQETILFGGSLAAGGVGADTWVWNGVDWSPRPVAVSPPARFSAAMAFDPTRGVVVLTGGRNGPLSAPFGDVWEWDGVAWIERVPVRRPLARAGAGLTFVPWLDGCLTFGGQERTGHPEDTGFVYRPVDPAQAEAYGTSCASSLGDLAVQVPSGAWPYLGRTVVLDASPFQTGRLVWFNFGLSDRQAGGLGLPLDLSPLGMTGCRLLASIEASALVMANGTAATFRLPIPLQPALVGGELFVQVLAADAATNPAGLVTSHGLRLKLGRG